ncbi:MAG: hypothetical protein EBY07_02530 [Actinobacteria bacterium]|nr:hypothetical protein [Actinomycetota bacterium]
MPVLRPTSVDQLLDILANDPSASLLAGGTDLMVEVNLHGRRPATVVSLRSLDELTEWSHRSGRVIHSVTVPVVEGWQGYAKVGTRNAMVISTASACLVHDSVEGLVSIALGAVGPTIIRATEAESWLARNVSLRGSLSISSDIATEFGRRVAAEARPISDHRSTADYRRHAISVLARRLLERAAI